MDKNPVESARHPGGRPAKADGERLRDLSFTVYLPSKLATVLRAEAERHYLSYAAYIRQILVKELLPIADRYEQADGRSS